MKDDAVYLAHVRDCIRRIEAHTSAGREAFLDSELHQDAVLRNLQTMCEATQRLSDTAKAKHPDVEWRQIAAFRNVLVHDYLGINVRRVWEVVERDLPRLKHAVDALWEERS